MPPPYRRAARAAVCPVPDPSRSERPPARSPRREAIPDQPELELDTGRPYGPARVDHFGVDPSHVFKELIYRVVGQPPAAASRGERLRWIRRFYVFSFVGVIAIAVLAIATGSTF